MEIQKIFSSYDEYGYEDERLYSVLMGEDEIRMFTGAIKKANKALKRAWLENKGYNELYKGCSVNIRRGKKLSDAAVKRGRYKLEEELLDTGRRVPHYKLPEYITAGPSRFKSMNLDQRINAKGVSDEFRRQLRIDDPYNEAGDYLFGKDIEAIQKWRI